MYPTAWSSYSIAFPHISQRTSRVVKALRTVQNSRGRSELQNPYFLIVLFPWSVILSYRTRCLIAASITGLPSWHSKEQYKYQPVSRPTSKQVVNPLSFVKDLGYGCVAEPLVFTLKPREGAWTLLQWTPRSLFSAQSLTAMANVQYAVYEAGYRRRQTGKWSGEAEFNQRKVQAKVREGIRQEGWPGR